MTATVTTLSGTAGSIGGYYGEQIAGYYGDGGPTSFWYGAGATRMGLVVVPTTGQITALMDGIDPGTGEILGRRFSKSKQRVSARGYDLTFGVPKDISVYWALTDAGERAEIEAAINAAAVAVLEHLDTVCPIRVGRDAEVVTGAGLAVAVVPEHTSRAGDPHLHVHCVISSKVQHPGTGLWYALDARELKLHQQALSALFHRGVEAELTRRLGFGWGTRKPEAFAAPLKGADSGLCDALSARTVAVKALYDSKLERFSENFDRQPSLQERHRLGREAAEASRPEKTPIDETTERVRWNEVAAQVAGPGASYVDQVKAAGTKPQPMTPNLDKAVMANAVGQLRDTRSTWRKGHLVTEIARHLPSGLDLSAGAVVRGTYDAAEQITNRTRTVDDDAVIEVSTAADDVIRTYTTTDILHQETQIAGWFDTAFATPTNSVAGDVDEHADRPLSEGQSQAAARTAGTAPVELIVGPAGTGKTTALQAAVKSLQTQGREVFGLAPSTMASDVLAETGCETVNVTAFLLDHEHKIGEYQLGAGATLIIDEAGMVSTPQWHTLTSLAQANGWRIVAVGDGYQFSAVGRGGMFDLLARTGPADRVTHLDKVHRFANEWEADASLKLRDGDISVIDTYLEHQRIHPATTDKAAIAAAADRWMDHHYGTDQHQHLARMRGQTPELGLFATSNDMVEAINKEIQKRRLAAGHFTTGGVNLGTKKKPRPFAIGDHVVTRRNNRKLTTDRGHYIRNRDRWTVTGYNAATKTVTVNGPNGTANLPIDYAKHHLQLAYAQTSHAAQGRTVDHSLLVIGVDDLADRAAIYVPLTRGRNDNHVIAAGTHTTTEAADRINAAMTRRWIDSPAITHLTPTPTAETSAEPTLAEMVTEARRVLAANHKKLKAAETVLSAVLSRHNQIRYQWDPQLAAAKQAVDQTTKTRDTHYANPPKLRRKKWETENQRLDTALAELTAEHEALIAAAATHLAPVKKEMTTAQRSLKNAITSTKTAERQLRQLKQHPNADQSHDHHQSQNPSQGYGLGD